MLIILKAFKSVASVEANANARDAAKTTKADANGMKDTTKGSKPVNDPEADKSLQKDSTQVIFFFYN